MQSFRGDEAGIGCSGRSGWNGSSAGGEVLVGVDARFVREAEGRIAGSTFLIVVGCFLHVRHGATVTHLKSNHSHQMNILKKESHYCVFQSFRPHLLAFISRWSCSVVRKMV